MAGGVASIASGTLRAIGERPKSNEPDSNLSSRRHSTRQKNHPRRNNKRWFLAQARDFNQALMDLGASICLPRNPDCAQCPVRVLCAGHLAGTQNALPVKTAKKPPEPYTLFQFRAERNGLVLLTQREKTGLFGGMWELPGFMVEGHKKKADPHRIRAQCAKLLGPGWRRDANSPESPERSPTGKILFRRASGGNFENTSPQADRNGLLWASEEDFRHTGRLHRPAGCVERANSALRQHGRNTRRAMMSRRCAPWSC